METLLVENVRSDKIKRDMIFELGQKRKRKKKRTMRREEHNEIEKKEQCGKGKGTKKIRERGQRSGNKAMSLIPFLSARCEKGGFFGPLFSCSFFPRIDKIEALFRRWSDFTSNTVTCTQTAGCYALTFWKNIRGLEMV